MRACRRLGFGRASLYLDRDQIEATLRVIEDRTGPGSRLVVAYHQPALMLLLLSVIVRVMGEPIRTVLTPSQMRELLARYGFSVRWDRELPSTEYSDSRRNLF